VPAGMTVEPVVEPVSVELTDAAFGGEAIGHLPDGRVVFVPRGLPGETALVRIQQEKRDFARAELAAIAQPSPRRVDPPCPYYTAGCGGCSWQHAEYALQLQLKERIVADQLRRIGFLHNLREMRISFIARNLFTVTNYSGLDPEVSGLAGDPFQVRMDWFQYPQFRTFTGSIELGF